MTPIQYFWQCQNNRVCVISDVLLTDEREVSGWDLQVEAKPWKQLQEEREALMTREIEKTKVSDTI